MEYNCHKNTMKKFFFCILSATLLCTNLFAAQIWPIYMDNQAYAQIGIYVVSDFRVNEVTTFLYNWEESYNWTSVSGANFYGNDNYISAEVSGEREWSGAGFCARNTACQTAIALRQAIIANPNNFYLHFAIKSTDQTSHSLRFLYNSDATDLCINLGATAPERHVNPYIYGDFPRNGEWYEFYVPMAAYASRLATLSNDIESMELFSFLSGAVVGSMVNLDAIYFCDADFMYNVDIANRNGGCPFIVNHRDNDALLSVNPITLLLPEAPVIEGFTFIGWQTVEEIIGTTINIQAVYTYNGATTSAPEVVYNPVNPAQKLIRNGNVYILTSDKTYTITGAEVK